jgi:hypothetical protein
MVSLLALAVLAGCGGAEKEEVVPGSNVPKKGKTVTTTILLKERKGLPADLGQWMAEIPVDPDGDLAFTVTKVIAPQGNANFRIKNPTAVGHDLTIREVGGRAVRTSVVRKGSAWVRISLFEDRRYVYYCSVPGHREAGMEGTIEVDPRLDENDLKPFRGS